MRPSVISNIVLLGILLLTWHQVEGEKLYNTEARLKTVLLQNYAKTVRPNASPNDTTTVEIGIALIDIESLDVEKDILTTHVWLRMFWDDERLYWDPASYNGLKRLMVPANLIWRPDIVPYNTAKEISFPDEFQAVLTPDETTKTTAVWLIPHLRLQTRCSVDLTNFPFDMQVCVIKLGSWVYNGNMVDLKAIGNVVDMSNYIPDSVWSVTETSAKINTRYYSCCAEPYPDYTANLTLRRTSTISVHLYVGPAVCIGLSLPIVFLLPAVSSAKLVLGGCLLVAQVLVMNMLASCFPSSHISTPIIAVYLLGNVVLLCLSLACSAVILCCWQRAKRGGTGVPAVIDKIFLGVLGRLMCVRREDYIEDESKSHDMNNLPADDSAAMVKEYTRIVAPAEWRQLAVVLDRLLFCIFLLISIITMFVMVRYTY